MNRSATVAAQYRWLLLLRMFCAKPLTCSEPEKPDALRYNGDSLPYADKLYLTYIDAEPKEADAFFPDYSAFKKTTIIEKRVYNGIPYDFRIVER